MPDLIIVGAGFAGSVIAQKAAEHGHKVLVIDKRNHIGGNAYDESKEQVLVHKYGPHIFHTSSERVWEYLSQFSEWVPYEHKVLGHVRGKLVPIPFNYASIDECFHRDVAIRLKKTLEKEYGKGKRVAIMDLLNSKDDNVRFLADFVFENIFKYYTMKQWGLEANEIDSAVTARVPVRLSYKDGYFDDKYQAMPKEGYTKLFENMLKDPNIEVETNVEAKDVLSLKDGQVFYKGELFKGPLVYSGALDELFDYVLGELPYRSVDLVEERRKGTFQTAATENYPGKSALYPYTRITEYKHFYPNEPKGYTYIHTEYPYPYDRDAEKGNIPYYPIFTPENRNLYHAYVELAEQYPQLILIGRLAEYKYYNMDAIVERALDVSNLLFK